MVLIDLELRKVADPKFTLPGVQLFPAMLITLIVLKWLWIPSLLLLVSSVGASSEETSFTRTRGDVGWSTILHTRSKYVLFHHWVIAVYLQLKRTSMKDDRAFSLAFVPFHTLFWHSKTRLQQRNLIS